ncbi:MAG: hypothetical protein KJO77_08375 [Bacteroidia bacterium]|nr:hypothetical protein [Bacteroidia bacterium]NND51672.1 hypothetical protein [Flavobacteriaceae bacterium]
MKTKTLIELITLSSSLYYLARDTNLIDRINELSKTKVEASNGSESGPDLDPDGKELDLTDKLIVKANQLKKELEEKIEESVVAFYKKVNIAHRDEIKALHEKLQASDATIALLEARLNHLEKKN